MNSPRMSKPSSVAPSPTSQQNFLQQSHSESDSGGLRVTFSQSNSTGNHTLNFTNLHKDSIEIHDGQDADAEEPLLVKQPSSKPS